MDRDFPLSSHLWRKSRVLAPLLISWTGLGFGVAGSAHALGVDRPLTQSALGQALSLVFPVLLKPGEMLAAECVQADVYAGEARVPPNLVQLVLEGESEGAVRAVRLYSPVPINEPLVHVSLSLGCPTQLSRQYTAFIDPPGLDQGVRAAAGATTRPPQYSPAMRAALGAAGARPETLLAAAVRVPAPAAVLPSAPPVKAPGATLMLAESNQPQPKVRAKPFRSVGVKSVPVVAGLAPQLRLEPPDADEAAESPLAQIAAAETALLRLRQLEETLNRLQQDNQVSRGKLQAMRTQLATPEVSEPPSLALLALGVLSLALAGFSAFLWRSRSRERAERDAAWWSAGRVGTDGPELASAAAGPAQGHTPGAVIPSPSPAGLQAAGRAPAPAEHVHEPAPFAGLPALGGQDERTITMPPQDGAELTEDRVVSGRDDAGEPAGRSVPSADGATQDDLNSGPLSIQLLDTSANFVNETGAFTSPVPLNVTAAGTDHVTVEELIDLEQQVEFFLVLGQSEAAIELLQARINFGGASALPYLKLLEIHQRQGEEMYFNEVAASFAKRFDALAPTWGADLNSGRDLEAYAAVVKRVQGRWADPAASMALLQDLLSKGGDTGHGFDLPAYRELLFLYSVARDRSEHEVRSDEIDLFLPLDSQNKPDDGHQLMATMIWQGKEMPGPQHALEVDISLDVEPVASALSSGANSRH
ncbi:FimV family protein [Paucibacter sp. DJ2R-2]|uniref:type IV pilus assembly protein FimV n=1 Tax=Paucibacter sp. DJ2R-2 TaxID=2893558 RepID=UPI0021E41B22|nr:hypothetical protein [Paucibacter sp. DJ2R-2]MCV2420765.1 hypothetical protein [Paucibacter sp. DJ4R-1]MCV2439964.1 hypothetical protein [Paucibacter sp. DJ2R-2]